MYLIKDLENQIASNPCLTILILSKKDYLRHKSQGHFETEKAGTLEHQVYRHYPVTYTSKGD